MIIHYAKIDDFGGIGGMCGKSNLCTDAFTQIKSVANCLACLDVLDQQEQDIESSNLVFTFDLKENAQRPEPGEVINIEPIGAYAIVNQVCRNPDSTYLVKATQYKGPVSDVVNKVVLIYRNQ